MENANLLQFMHLKTWRTCIVCAIFNLSYELNCLEKIKEENEHVFKKEYRHCFETAIEELKGLKNVIDQDHTIEPNYIITMVDFLNKLILRGFTELTKTYPEHGFYIKY